MCAHAILSRAGEKNSQWFFWRRKCAWFIHQPFKLCLVWEGRMGMCEEPEEARLGCF